MNEQRPDQGTDETSENEETGGSDDQMSGARADSGGTGPEVGGSVATDSHRRSDPEEWKRALDEQRDKYLRVLAEQENFKKRAIRERQEAGWRAQAEMVRGLIDAIDDLSRFAHVDPQTVDPTTLVQGIEMVERKAMKSLAGHGLEIIDPIDQPFDPAVHEAVGTEPALSREDDHLIARVYQRGYVFNGQLLRPARVVVKQWAGGSAAD